MTDLLEEQLRLSVELTDPGYDAPVLRRFSKPLKIGDAVFIEAVLKHYQGKQEAIGVFHTDDDVTLLIPANGIKRVFRKEADESLSSETISLLPRSE